MDIVIYGAQAIALGAFRAIHRLCPERKVRCFLVTKLGSNADMLSGVPVIELEKYLMLYTEEELQDCEILIATPESVMGEIEQGLAEKGLHNYVRMTSLRWAELMKSFYIKEGNFLPVSVLPVGSKVPDVKMYMAKSHKDQKLIADYQIPDWLQPIQVGAARTEERIERLCDNIGEHISDKNGNYSELTALYWIWKNAISADFSKVDEKYVGLAHYRRILDLSEDDLRRLYGNDVDVVLSYPMIYEPDIEAHHERYVKKEDWAATLQALEELQPEYARVFPEILSQQYFINYNIFLAKESVFAEYCAWLFPILEKVEEYSTPKGNERNDRYIGYIGESMTTLYFMKNRERLNVKFAGCRFLL